jgi:lipopolysaccharide export system protein LptA
MPAAYHRLNCRISGNKVFFLFLLWATPFTADKLEIINEDGMSVVHLIGNVVIEDQTLKITCSQARLHESDDYVVLIDDVDIIDKNGEIKAAYAVFYFEDSKGYLKDSVTLFSGDEVITADSLFYDGVADQVKMFRDVVIDDKKNDLMAFGQEGWYDLKADEGYLFKEPRLEIAREDKEPMMVNAHEFRLRADSNQFFGYDSVVALIDSITIYCDTFMYNMRENIGTMVKPVVIEKDNRLHGQTGQFTVTDNEITVFRTAGQNIILKKALKISSRVKRSISCFARVKLLR